MKLIDILDEPPFPIGYRLAFLTNFWREPMLRMMEKQFGIIRPELTVLMCLNFRDEVHARDICEVTEQPSNTVSRGVASLEEKGFLVRTRDKSDTRRQVLRITQEGREIHDQIMKLFEDSERKMLSILSSEEKTELNRLLDKVARDVDSWRSQ